VTVSPLSCAKTSGIFSSEGFRGEISRMAKQILNDEQVHWIRTSGLTDAHMARTLGIGYVTVHNARRGITFKEHPTPPDTTHRKPGGKTSGTVAVASEKNCGVPALTFEAVHFIRTSGLPDSELATKYGVSLPLVTRARRGLSWKDHPTPPDRFPRSFGQIKYAGEQLSGAPSINLRFEPRDRVLFDRLRMRCVLDADGCWIWTGATSSSEPRPSGNHGATSLNGEGISTHRAMWTALYGQIPADICICHTCDKPPCIHPFHLWPGTHADNMRDSILKGRHVNVRGRD
jgi:hypothetical protein